MLKEFKSNEFGNVRTIEESGQVWFVAIDVCKALNHSNPTVAMNMLEEDERTKLSLGRQGVANVVNESGLYTLIIKSNKDKAKQFRKWVTSEVLPSIRQNGGYLANQENMDEEQIMARALQVAQNVINRKQKELEYKEDVIIGLTKDVSLADKQQRINQIIRHTNDFKKIRKRWKLLYSEFDKTYHINSKTRFNRAKENGTIKKSQTLVGYICKDLGMTDQLYKTCVKLFESDARELFKNIMDLL